MTESIERGVDAKCADTTLYLPWNTLVFYYKNYECHDVLIPIGYVESGMNLLADRGDDFTVTIVLYNESVSESQQEINNITIISDLLAFDLLGESVEFLIEISE